MTDILSMNLDDLKTYMLSIGEKAFRAGQIYRCLHLEMVSSYDEMTTLSKALRAKLAQEAPLQRAAIETVQISGEDGTRKYLFRMSDGHFVESVFMKYHHGNSVCISSQVGCRMGCRFCASTIGGKTRDLTAGEMLGQIEQIEKDTAERVSNVVVMGTGEPLDNYDNLVYFIRLLTDENGLHISQRNVTVSTCGLAPRIYQLAEEGFQINLALSLHAPEDTLRQTIMPIAGTYSLKEVMAAMDYYYKKTGRRLTFEYSLIRGTNDTDECAAALGRLLKGKEALVNLIPVNPVRERSFSGTDRGETLAFQKKLEKTGLHVTIRRELGRDIDGACGQLRKHYAEAEADNIGKQVF